MRVLPASNQLTQPIRSIQRAMRRLCNYNHGLHGMLVSLSAWLLLAGCSVPVGGGQNTPTPTPTAQEIAARVVEEMQAASSLSFVIDFAGVPVYADPDEQFAILGVEGTLRRPDAALATIRVRNVGSIAQIRLVSLDGQMYATNPITRDWICFPPGVLFDPVILFDPERGLEPLLRDQLENISLVGIEELEGRPHYHLRGTMDGQPLGEISHGMLGVGTVEADLWAEQESFRASRIVLVDTGTDPDNPSVWDITFSGYDEDVDMRAPIECPDE